MQPVSYWFFIGTFYLIYLAARDLYYNEVDTKTNFFMLGITISLFSHLKLNILYVLGLFILVSVHTSIYKKLNFDIERTKTVSWIILGLGMMSLTYVLTFITIFLPLALLYILLKNYIYKIKVKAPFYIIILLSFIINSIVIGGYLT